MGNGYMHTKYRSKGLVICNLMNKVFLIIKNSIENMTKEYFQFYLQMKKILNKNYYIEK